MQATFRHLLIIRKSYKLPLPGRWLINFRGMCNTFPHYCYSMTSWLWKLQSAKQFYCDLSKNTEVQFSHLDSDTIRKMISNWLAALNVLKFNGSAALGTREL